MKPCPILLLLLLAVPCHARQVTPETPSATVPPSVAVLDSIRYNPKESGALFCVAPPSGHFSDAQQTERKTAAQFAESIQCRLLRETSVSALVPQAMFTVASVPKSGDPFAGMNGGERFQVLLGTLSAAQWNSLGGDTGIGIGDLTLEQRPLFAGMFPAEDFQLQTMRLLPERDEDGEALWEPQGEPQIHPVRGARLRLRRQTMIAFPGADDSNGYFSTVKRADSDENYLPGETKTDLVNGYTLTGDAPTDRVEGEQTVYGLQTIFTEQNRAKPSDLNLSAPVFKTTVLLDGSHKTVGDLVAACAKKTRLSLVVDKRMATLPIGWRVAEGGHVAPVGEVLTLLCRSLTGTFRRLTPPDGSPPIYLLTDDREGLGTRLARLYDWQQQMQGVKDAMLHKADEAAAKSDPLSHVRFAPDDPLALPPALSSASDAAYRASDDGVSAKIGDLPPALRNAANKRVTEMREYTKNISTELMRVGTSLLCEYVLSDGKAIEAPFGGNLPTNYLRTIATITRKPPAEPKPTTVTPLPTLPRAVPRRICAVSLPATDAETKTLLQLLRAKGFTEAWFAVSLYDADAPARLEKAAATGKSIKIAVGASASWLKRDANAQWGTDDINLLGETGAQFMVRMLDMFRGQIESGSPPVPSPDEVEYIFDFLTREMSGWTVPEATPAQVPLRRLLTISQLSAVVLTDTAAPGWNKDAREAGLPPGFALGCTLPTRIACVRATGIDPIDVSEDNGVLGAVPLLRSETVSGVKAVNDFRAAANRRELSVLMATAAPSAALYQEETVSLFGGGTPVYFRYAPGDAKPTETLAAYAPTMDYKTEAVVAGIVRTARTAPKSGFVVNFGRLRPADRLRYLKALADTP